jgi:serine/threonine protein kinase
MEYVKGLSVEMITDYSKFTGAKMPTNFISAILKGVVHALKYLHTMNIIHRDVKGGNILVATNGNVKLVDYGLSTVEGHCMQTCGTLCFMAPEVVQGIPYTKAVDIWSLGMTAVEMLNNDDPYREVSSTERLKESIVNNIMPAISSEAPLPHALKHFITSCLNPEPSKRHTAAELRPHALFSFFQASPTDIGDTIISIQEHIYDIEYGY